MTSLHEHDTPREGEDMGPVIDDKTTISVPMVIALMGALLGAIVWANAMNVTLAGVQRDQINDRERLQRIEQAVERVEAKIDRIRERQQP